LLSNLCSLLLVICFLLSALTRLPGDITVLCALGYLLLAICSLLSALCALLLPVTVLLFAVPFSNSLPQSSILSPLSSHSPPLVFADSLLPLSPVEASVLLSYRKRIIFTLEGVQASMGYGTGVPRWVCVLVWAVVVTGAVGAADGPWGSVAKQERQDCLGLFPTPYCDRHYPDPSTADSSIPLTASGIPVQQCRQQSKEEAREVRACRGLRAAVQGASAAVVHSPGLGPLRGRQGANTVVGTLTVAHAHHTCHTADHTPGAGLERHGAGRCRGLERPTGACAPRERQRGRAWRPGPCPSIAAAAGGQL
jgi:hypothetical protein